MRRRLALFAVTGVAAVGAAVPAIAQTTTSPAATLPVGVVYNTNNGVFVGVTILGRPGVGAGVQDGKACVGVSLQVPQCVVIPPAADNIPQDQDITVGPAHAFVGTGGGVVVETGLGGQPLVGASLGNGWLCIGFSEEVPSCWPLVSPNARADRPAL